MTKPGTLWAEARQQVCSKPSLGSNKWGNCSKQAARQQVGGVFLGRPLASAGQEVQGKSCWWDERQADQLQRLRGKGPAS